MSKFNMLTIFCAGLLTAMVGSAAEPAAADSPTLKDLESAYGDESNEKARYEAFAVRADEEGYKGAAALFRAAAKSEGVHLQQHAAAIKKLGAEPKVKSETPNVKSTEENLRAAMEGEDYERDVMYPTFFEQARMDKNTDAAQSFKDALLADIEHAKFFRQARGTLDAWTAEKTFLVCTVCGFTTMDLTLKSCPVCSAPQEKFDEVK